MDKIKAIDYVASIIGELPADTTAYTIYQILMSEKEALKTELTFIEKVNKYFNLR